MSTTLSRRALFRAFRESPRETLSPAPVALDRVARIGAACVEPRGVVCRRCGDECEARAISFRLLGAGKASPKVDAEACTGCGACLAVCPVNAIELIAGERAALIAGLVQLGAHS